MRPFLPYTTLLVFFVAWGFTSSAQQPNPYFNFRHLNSANGLAQDIAYHFLQDSRGFMWIGTRRGLSMFDGTRTVNFTHEEKDTGSLSDNFITGILEDSSHRLWIGTGKGIDLLNRQENTFTHFLFEGADGKKTPMFCSLLGFADPQHLWFIETHTHAIRSLDTRNGTSLLLASSDATDGRLFVSARENTVHVWTYLSLGTTHFIFAGNEMKKREQFFTGEDVKRSPQQIYHVLQQNDTTVWLSAASGLIAFHPESGNSIVYNHRGSEAVIELRTAMCDTKGILWIGTGGNGVYTFDIRTHSFLENYRNDPMDPMSVCSNNIVSLFSDREGNIWCGSYGRGVSYAYVKNGFFQKHLSRSALHAWNRSNALEWTGVDNENNTWCIFQDVPGFWKLNRELDIQEYKIPVLENGKPFIGSVYQMLFDADGVAWCGTDRGLFRYSPRTNRMQQIVYKPLVNTLFGSTWINSLTWLEDGTLLFTTFAGVYRVFGRKEPYRIQSLSIRGLPETGIYDFVSPGGTGRILLRDNNSRLNWVRLEDNGNGYTLIKSWPMEDGVFQSASGQSDSLIWLASGGGLYAFNPASAILVKSSVNKKLPFASVNGVISKDSSLWIFGEKGLYLLNKTSGEGRYFSTDDGLPSNLFNPSTIVLSKNGTCLAGTDNGLLSFRPVAGQSNSQQARPQIIQVFVNDSTHGFVPNAQETDAIHLEYNQNTFSFSFSTIAFQHGEESTFRYRLEPYDEKWISSGPGRYTRYNHVPPGKYRFMLQTVDGNGIPAPFPKTMEVVIGKAFWQTWIFRIFAALAALFVLYKLFRTYLAFRIHEQQRSFERQQAIEKERTRIATDMHDDLGAGLSSIRFLGEKVKRNSFSEITRGDIDKMLFTSSELIDKMNEIIWAMNERNDSMEDLLFYARAYAKEYCEENNLDCHIELPEQIPQIFVSGEVRRNVFLTIKESLHNIVKHASAKCVHIEIRTGTQLHISIQDDGVGFHAGNGSQGNGLKNMEKRIVSLNGTFKRLNRKGAAIEFKIPLQV